MSHCIVLTVLCSIGVVLRLNPTDVLACRANKQIISAQEEEGNERAIETHRKAVQAQNIRVIGKALPRTKVSARDRRKREELRTEA
jgi:hypothetical protein